MNVLWILSDVIFRLIGPAVWNGTNVNEISRKQWPPWMIYGLGGAVFVLGVSGLAALGVAVVGLIG